MSTADLLLNFESLGNDCEFGIIQRLCGVEPLGLFRFSSSSIDNLIDVITTDARTLYTADDLMVKLREDGEYYYKSGQYDDFLYHTHKMRDETSAETLFANGVKTMGFLKGKFQETLRQRDKIFVRKGPERGGDIERLHRSLRRTGPNTLLWVARASPYHPAGSVDLIDEGLLRGYLTEFKDFSNNRPFDLESWLELCRRAYEMNRVMTEGRAETVYDSPRLLAYKLVKRLANLLEPRDASFGLRKLRRESEIWLAIKTVAEHSSAEGDFQQVDDVLERGLRAYPDDPTFLKAYARNAQDLERSAEAVVRWETALNRFPRDPQCFLGFATSLHDHGHVAAAAEVIANAAVFFPDDAMIRAEAARLRSNKAKAATDLPRHGAT